MTQHTHQEVVPGCYRCELSMDEIRELYPSAQLPTIGDKAQTRPTQQELDRLTRKFPSKKDRK